MIIVITGPTASGKSKIAIEIAKEFNGEIVNADVFQMYKELNIGTAKPSPEDMNIVPHHLYDFLEPTDRYSIAQYQTDGRKVIDEILSRKKTVVLVGGSGLYLRSVLYDYKFLSEKSIDNNDFESLTNEELYDELKKIDPEEASKLHPNNRKRVERALSIYKSIGKTKSEIIASQEHKLVYENVYIYCVMLDRKDLYENINKRTDLMIEAGLPKEVTELTKKYGTNLQSLNAIGYREIIENPNDDTPDVKEKIQKNTRNYAKRQITFIKNQFPVRFIKSARDIIYDIKNSSITSRTEMLLGLDNMQTIKNLKVAVIGIGGVGGTAAEALVRSGIKEIGLVDRDKVQVTNLNRQILYTSKDVGQNKVDIAKTRFLNINPSLIINKHCLSINEQTIPEAELEKYDFVIDCIDDVSAKLTLYSYLINHKIPFISCLGMGNRFDIEKLHYSTLDKTNNDPLAKKIRSEIKNTKVDPAKIPVVFSDEIPVSRNGIITSMIFTPSKAGLMAANYCLKYFIDKEEE